MGETLTIIGAWMFVAALLFLWICDEALCLIEEALRRLLKERD